MSDKPRIYGYCAAGCKWETVHKDDFLKSAAMYEKQSDDDGNYAASVLEKYKIYSSKVQADYETLTATLPTTTGKVGTAAIGTKVYLFGGEIAYEASSDVLTLTDNISVFDSETETIETLTTKLPTAASDITTAVVGTKIYLFGGFGRVNGSVSWLDTIRVFDSETGTIETLTATLATGCKGYAAAIGTKVYLFGLTYTDNISVFDSETETIETLTTKLPTVMGDITAAVVGTKIYLFGGYASGSWVDTICVFDSETETIETLTETLTATSEVEAMAIGTKVYLYGVNTNSSNSTTDIRIFDCKTGDITFVATLPLKYSSALVAVGTKIYFFGSGDISHSDYTDTINAYNLSAFTSKVVVTVNDIRHFLSFSIDDKYRDYFVFELLAIEAAASGNGTMIVYEINGERYEQYLNYTSDNLADCKVEILEATEVYVYNSNAEVVVGKIEGEEETWTFTLEDGTTVTKKVYVG